MIIKAYVDGFDMHKMTASILYNVPLKEVTKEQRQQAKSVNFAILYGSSASGLAWNFKITRQEGQEILDKFFGTYSIFGAYKTAMEDAIVRNGFSMTQLGRRRYFDKPQLFDDAHPYDKWERKLKKEGFNMVVQGTGADITKFSMVDIHEHNMFGDKLKPVLQQHDELLYIVADDVAEEAAKFIETCMLRQEQVFLGAIPAAVEGKISTKWEH
jgi:DNA polymerase-1